MQDGQLSGGELHDPVTTLRGTRATVHGGGVLDRHAVPLPALLLPGMILSQTGQCMSRQVPHGIASHVGPATANNAG